MTYLLVILAFATLVYVGWRLGRPRADQSARRVIGPDDDPEFLRRLNRGDNNPR